MLYSILGENFTKLLQIHSKQDKWRIEILLQAVVTYAFMEKTASF